MWYELRGWERLCLRLALAVRCRREGKSVRRADFVSRPPHATTSAGYPPTERYGTN